MSAAHEKGCAFRFRVKGASMAPFIQAGDILTVTGSAEGYDIGEIAAFVFPSDKRKLIVHRIVSKRNGMYLLKGDNIPARDGFIPEDNMLGKVARVERDGREILFGARRMKRTIALLSRWNILQVLLYFLRLLPRFVKEKIKMRGRLYG